MLSLLLLTGTAGLWLMMQQPPPLLLKASAIDTTVVTAPSSTCASGHIQSDPHLQKQPWYSTPVTSLLSDTQEQLSVCVFLYQHIGVNMYVLSQVAPPCLSGTLLTIPIRWIITSHFATLAPRPKWNIEQTRRREVEAPTQKEMERTHRISTQVYSEFTQENLPVISLEGICVSSKTAILMRHMSYGAYFLCSRRGSQCLVRTAVTDVWTRRILSQGEALLSV